METSTNFSGVAVYKSPTKSTGLRYKNLTLQNANKKKAKSFQYVSNFKGALNKYDNTYLFISNSAENFKLNQYQNFQLILQMRFHFMRYFMNRSILRVSQRLLYCVPGGGGTHIFGQTWMCRSNGSLFYKKSLKGHWTSITSIFLYLVL